MNNQHNLLLKVTSKLREIPVTRDDDIELIREVWLHEYPFMAPHINALCDSMHLGELSFPDSITRGRRKCQEKNETLRGELWKIRQAMSKSSKQLWFDFAN